MVIAVFMAAVLVGATWYMFGLGEAMIYRQQLRAAVDATAFDAATVHALGMNMLAMMNIAMAAVLSILVALMVIFVGALALTLVTTGLLFVPGVNIIDAGVEAALIRFDEQMVSIIQKVQPKIFWTLTALNVSEGSLAIAMPWASAFVSTGVASNYGPAVASTLALSPSMAFTRVPYYFNMLDSKLKSRLPKLPIIQQPPAPFKLALLARYGLPVQDDTYGMLCMHAGTALVQELGLLVKMVSAGLISPPPDGGALAAIVGQAVGTVPWMFCSGLDPTQMMNNLLSGQIFNPTAGLSYKNPSNPSMFPMKPFDEAKNGNGFMQVYASATGAPTFGTGSVMGVAIAGWTQVAPTPNQGADSDDFAEAEFYFDCGGPRTAADETVLGTSDMSGDWQTCKYNAMWNLQWKTRMRRFHQFEFNLAKEIELDLYQGLGIDNYIKNVIPTWLIPQWAQEGSTAKEFAFDRIKACFVSIGQGGAASGDFGKCPFPVMGFITFPDNGYIGIGSSTKDGYPMQDVVH